MKINNSLKGKKILFISVKTFGYEKEILDELKKYSEEVDFFDERPSNSIFTKGLIRLNKNILNRKIKNYYRRITERIKKKKYDYFFLIKGETIPITFIEEFKSYNKECTLILYSWDSMENNTNLQNIYKYFDKVYTFDSHDARKYNFILRPLFFIDEYRKLSKLNHSQPFYDLLFIGTAHSDRYILSNSIHLWCKKNNLKMFNYLYLQNIFVFYFKKLFDKSFQAIDLKNLNFNPLNLTYILELYSNSRIILDIHHPDQRGITMRTIEAIGAGKKVITTNQQIESYSFFSKNNFFVIDRENPKIPRYFFKSKYIPLSEEDLDDLSLKGWLNFIFFESNNGYIKTNSPL